MATTLPFEMIADILHRLPVKDLLRYRCVSRKWCSLIDGPDFIKRHLNHSKQTNSNLAAVLFNENEILWADLEASGAAVKLHRPADDGDKMEVLGSCNGLLALLNSRDDVVLWNPSTRRYKKLTPTDEIDCPSGFFYHGLHFYGFGHDPINDDYKLVKITQFHGELEDAFDSEIEIYSSKSDSWKRNKRFLPYRLQNPNGVLVGNALHWFAARQRKSDDSGLILAFDLVTEECREIAMPKYNRMMFTTTELDLDVLGSSLCVTCNHVMRHHFLGVYEDFTSARGVDIWVMKQYGVKRSWTRLLFVEPSEENGGFASITPVAYLKSRDQVILLVDNNRFVLYDLKRKRDKRVRISGLPKQFGVHLCVGSLVGLNGGWGDGKEKRKKRKKKKKMKDQEQRNKKQEPDRKQRDDFLSKGFKLVL